MFGRERVNKDFSLRIFIISKKMVTNIKLAFTNKCFFFLTKFSLCYLKVVKI